MRDSDQIKDKKFVHTMVVHWYRTHGHHLVCIQEGFRNVTG